MKEALCSSNRTTGFFSLPRYFLSSVEEEKNRFHKTLVRFDAVSAVIDRYISRYT